MKIFSDFDGTISQCDVTDLVLETFAAAGWNDIENAWKRGDISAADCMRQQIALVRADQAALTHVLDSVQLDPGFLDFAAWAAESDFPLTVVSDGVDHFIRHILKRHGLAHIAVYANALCKTGDAFALQHPWKQSKCLARSGVCKCELVAPSEVNLPITIFIGDGRSDECVSPRADLLFAKGHLARYCDARAIAYLPYTNFHDVTAALSRLVGDLAQVRPQEILSLQN